MLDARGRHGVMTSSPSRKGSPFARLRSKTLAELVQIAQSQPCPIGFIQKIRFPYYRNIERDAELVFTFPISIFTGANGCGKSSVLQALYGAPADYSVGRYWFSTDVDPISDSADGRRPSFVYEYLGENGRVLQPIKTRIRKKFSPGLLSLLKRTGATDPERIQDPNYWEPSRPLGWAGQTPRTDGSRDPAVKREVIYLHFRTQLSAFESVFFGGGPPTTERREFLRVKSKYLLRAFDGLGSLRPRGKQQSKDPAEVDGDAIQEVNSVVGKKYLSAQVMQHKLFGVSWAESVRFKLPNATYSDAFAGSGEGAVLRVVRALQTASDGALIILDEPEISLHPEAQKRMQLLLLAYAIHKKLQIFVATHSSHFVDGLPEKAIFLFQEGGSGAFSARNVPAELALVSIGHELARRTIVVEDILAQQMVQRTLKELEEAERLFDVKVAPGGVGSALAVLAHDASEAILLLLDGDQRPDPRHVEEARSLLAKHTVSRATWDAIIVKLTNNNVPTWHQSGDGASGKAAAGEAALVRRRFVQAFLKRVSYLPGAGPPENLLVTKDALLECFRGLGIEPGIHSMSALPKSKSALHAAAERLGLLPTTVIDMLLARWAKAKGEGHDELRETLRSLVPRGL